MPILRSSKPKIIITMGDPSGIGPEVALKALASPKVKRLADFFLVGDGYVMDRARHATGLKLKFPLIDLKNIPARDFSYGSSNALFGHASIEYIDKAVYLIKKGQASSLVTAPINKYSVKLSGLSGFSGHTEYLAAKTGTKKYAMMFAGERLKVSLVTRHIALKDVPKSITKEKICDTIELTYKYLKANLKIKNPRIGVAGLNPHAGEGGSFGDEEKKVIEPAIKAASKRFKNIIGPVPADILFHDALNGKVDACVAMYHDQALAPFKMLYFKDGVNITLGLPFVRTSPDHGTAFNIAGRGIADPSSMIAAIRLAAC